MALTDKQYEQLKDEVKHCKNPLFFFHDDPDGLCSFLLLYRHIGDGKGICIKTSPKVDASFIRKVEEYNPDKIFILDLALVNQDFLDGVKVPVIWIDHHEPLKRNKVKYFNPRVNDPEDNIPVSYICYRIVGEDLWIAVCGIVGDWFLPPLSKEFSEKYPKLLPKNIKKPDKALFSTRLGELIKIFSFILKGKTEDVMKCIKVLTRVKTPYEILDRSTPQGKFILRRAKHIEEHYKELLKEAMGTVKKENMILYSYRERIYSFTKELSNELLFKYPGKVIVVCREKSGEMKCSLRSGKKLILPPILKKALHDIDGYGGGHEHACGACIKNEDFNQFIENLKKLI